MSINIQDWIQEADFASMQAAMTRGNALQNLSFERTSNVFIDTIP
jgi:hypothetical protein